MQSVRSHYPPLTLKVVSGQSAGAELCGQELTSVSIGREKENHLVLTDRGVSRYHGRFLVSETGWSFEDLGSTNGVVLTRQGEPPDQFIRAQQVVVKTGDVLQIGQATLRVEIQSVNEETELLVPDTASVATELLIAARLTSIGDNCSLPDQSAAQGGLFSDLSPLSRILQRTPPFTFRDYHIVKKIGEGGMGEVYLATRSEDHSGEPRLAIKFLRSQHSLSAADRARFVREMGIAAQLKHASIIECLDCGDQQGQPFIVMPYCSGGNLAELLERAGPLNLKRGIRLLDRLLAGVDCAHQAGIVHRDLKPVNVLLAQHGPRRFLPKISDFGLAKSYLLAGESGMTVNGTVGGSWGYMPREQLTNFRFVSPCSDVWSLGAIFFECLTGRLPRPMQPNADPVRVVIDSKLIAIEQLLPSIPTTISSLLAKSLSVEVEDRYQDAAQMRAALHDAAAQANLPI